MLQGPIIWVSVFLLIEIVSLKNMQSQSRIKFLDTFLYLLTTELGWGFYHEDTMLEMNSLIKVRGFANKGP